MALIAFGFAHCAGRLEGLGDLVVQLHPVGHDHERPVPRHLAQHLLREEHHRKALATALRLPEHAAAPAAGLAGREHRGDGIVDAEELVVLADDLHQSGLVLGEEREVLHHIEQSRLSQVPRIITSSDTRRGSSSLSMRFHSKKRSQSAVSEPTRLSVPFDAMSKALYQNSAGIFACL